MPYLGLEPYVSFTLVEGTPVFLDLRRDRYFALDGLAAPALEQLRHNAGGQLDDTTAQALLATGLFAASRSPSPLSPVALPAAATELPGKGSGLRPLDLIEVAWCIGRARRALRSQPLERLVERCREARGRGRQRPDDRPIALAARFQRARPWVPVAPSCLQDSLALHRWLARRGASAELVLGVKLHPFAAHCWMQLGPTLLNDRLETVAAFTPILAV